MKEYTLEVCVDSVESALAAQRGGATRLELCANLIIGGTTPSPALFSAVKKHTGLPVNVLVRPRFGDFCYTPYEKEIISEEIRFFTENGANGIVCGALCPDGTLDKETLWEWVLLAQPAKFTLHRAFDVCVEPFAALKTAQELGVDTILTSGQSSSCAQGIPLLRELVPRAHPVHILAGGGVTPQNLPRLIRETGVNCFHLSAKTEKDSPMVYRKSGVPMGLPVLSEYKRLEADEAIVAAAKRLLEKAWFRGRKT